MTTQSRRLPWWKKIVFSALILALVLAVVEAAAWVGGAVAFGGGASWRRLQTHRDALVESRGRMTGTPRWLQNEILHPYVGFLPAVRVAQGLFGVARAVPAPAPADAADRIVVAVIGGSFAMQFAEEGAPHLVARLAELPAFRGKTFLILNAAAGGHKQPQQLMMTAYLHALGQRTDILINLDGFNEVTVHPIENGPAGVFPAYPRRWHQRVEGVLSRDALRVMIERAGLEDRRSALARTFSRRPWRFAATANLLYLALDTRVEAQLVDLDRRLLKEEELARVPVVATGPPAAFASDREMFAHLVEVWRRSSRALHDLTAASGGRYYHFLQPNQYVPGSKPMSAAEARDAVRPAGAYRRVVPTAYPLLRESGRSLAASGVRFEDLSAAFAAHPEPLYIDICCHVNRRGNLILADRIFETIRRDLAREGGSAR